MKLLAPFQQDAKACRDIFYTFEQTISLDDSKLNKLLPDFKQTDMDQAIEETLAWYRN